jgi:uncharacterized protein
MRLQRREFLSKAMAASAAAMFGNSFLRSTLARAAAVPGPGPYGDLLAANADGLQLPAGFTSRLVATSGLNVGPSTYEWHYAPDGGACFPMTGGGWVYVSNSEISSGGGGAGAVRFDASGNIVDAYSILTGTTRNCSGGRTPWGTWLSCEESGPSGLVWECNPLSAGQGIARPALGTFTHEAAVVDAATGHVYMTEDEYTGRLYRFVPTVNGDLTSGQLYAASVSNGVISWVPTSTTQPDRQPSTTAFDGGEGMVIDNGSLYFTTQGDQKVWEIVLATGAISVLYDGYTTVGGELFGVDGITAHPPSGDLYVCEDGGNRELVIIAVVNGVEEVTPFARFIGHDYSGIAGVAFSPDNTRLYVSSLRGTDGYTGLTY